MAVHPDASFGREVAGPTSPDVAGQGRPSSFALIPPTTIIIISMSRLHLTVLLLAALGAPALAQTTQTYRLQHRIFHPAFEAPLWQTRGAVRLEQGAAAVEAHPDVAADLETFAAAMRAGIEAGEDTSEVLYQVALEREDDKGSGHWDISSVKAVRPSLMSLDERRGAK